LALSLVGGAALLSSAPAHAAQRRLPLESFGHVEGIAGVADRLYDGLIELPSAGTSSISFGFTVPDDFRQGALELQALVDSPAANCTFAVRAAKLHRARSGRARDAGAADGGFRALGASAPFTLTSGGKGMTFAAGGEALKARRLRFKIEPNAPEFPAFAPGDAVSFTVERRADEASDTCPNALRWLGSSILYDAKPVLPAKARLSLDPFAAYTEDTGQIAFSTTGLEAPLRLPHNAQFFLTPETAWSFVLPLDAADDAPIDVEVLWESESPNCSALFAPHVLQRADKGELRDGDPFDPRIGLTFVSATTAVTPSNTAPGARLVRSPGAVTGKLVYRIRPTPGIFPSYGPGTAFLFSLRRKSDEPVDTCGELGFSGVSVLYARDGGSPARRLSLDALQIDRGTNTATTLDADGFVGAIRVQRGGRFSSGIVLPEDFRTASGMSLELLVNVEDERNCSAGLASHHLTRYRLNGRADEGHLEGFRASTPNDQQNGGRIVFSSGAEDRTIEVSFNVEFPPGTPPLQAGDVLSFGLERIDQPDDTCAGSLNINGWSLAHLKKQ
jgi:hypothetical protein